MGPNKQGQVMRWEMSHETSTLVSEAWQAATDERESITSLGRVNAQPALLAVGIHFLLSFSAASVSYFDYFHGWTVFFLLLLSSYRIDDAHTVYPKGTPSFSNFASSCPALKRSEETVLQYFMSDFDTSL